MESVNRMGIGFVMALVVAGFVGAFGVAPAAAKTTVKCQVTVSGKSEVKKVADADACTKMGGKVVPPKKSHKESAPSTSSGSGAAHTQ